MEQRPATGLWGGLLALPVLPGDCIDPLGWTAENLGLEVGCLVPRPPLHHDFTHFHLEMQPLLGNVTGSRPMVRQDKQSWLDLGELAEAPLPAPVRKLLACLPAN